MYNLTIVNQTVRIDNFDGVNIVDSKTFGNAANLSPSPVVSQSNICIRIEDSGSGYDYAWDAFTGAPNVDIDGNIAWLQTNYFNGSTAGGGGGPVTIADGADVAEGATTDPLATNPYANPWTVISLLKSIANDINNGHNVAIPNGADVAEGSTTDGIATLPFSNPWTVISLLKSIAENTYAFVKTAPTIALTAAAPSSAAQLLFTNAQFNGFLILNKSLVQPYYLKFYNQAAVPNPLVDIPVLTYLIPPTASILVPAQVLLFDNESGLWRTASNCYVRATANYISTDTTSPTAGDLTQVTYWYKS